MVTIKTSNCLKISLDPGKTLENILKRLRIINTRDARDVILYSTLYLEFLIEFLNHLKESLLDFIFTT